MRGVRPRRVQSWAMAASLRNEMGCRAATPGRASAWAARSQARAGVVPGGARGGGRGGPGAGGAKAGLAQGRAARRDVVAGQAAEVLDAVHRRTDDLGLQRQPIAVAADELHDRLDALLAQGDR